MNLLSGVQDKEGRLDVLAFGLASLLTQKLEEKINLPGLSKGVMPILEDEIKKAIPSETVIPTKYLSLTRLLGEYVSK